MLSGNDLQRLFIESRSDPQARDRLLALYRPVLRVITEQMLYSGLRRREDASDIVQVTELEAYQAFDQFRGQTECEFSAWLKQILRRNIANVVRDNRAAKRDHRREQYLDAGGDSISITWWQPEGRGSSPSQHAINAEAAINLLTALQELPDAQRQAVQLRHLHGCSLDEIAAAMEKSPAAVAGLLRRGLQALRERVGRESPSI